MDNIRNLHQALHSTDTIVVGAGARLSTVAGVQLREECHRLMLRQGHEDPTGQAKITKAYNLPCKYAIHTVGPIIPNGIPTEFQKEQLASCYRSIMIRYSSSYGTLSGFGQFRV